MDTLSHIEHDERLELDLEQELIAEFREQWNRRGNGNRHHHLLRDKANEIRELRKNRDRFPDKFAIAHKGYIFYRNQGWEIKKQIDAYEISELDDHFSIALRKEDMRKAVHYMKDLRNLLTTDFYKDVSIDISLVLSMYADLGVSLYGEKGSLEKEDLKKFKRDWD